jgi:hypothetical protein
MVVAYSLDYRGHSKEFMFGTSWAVGKPKSSSTLGRVPLSPRLTNFWIQFLAFGCVAVLPILKFYLKDTNMIETIEDVNVTELHEEIKASEEGFTATKE